MPSLLWVFPFLLDSLRLGSRRRDNYRSSLCNPPTPLYPPSRTRLFLSRNRRSPLLLSLQRGSPLLLSLQRGPPLLLSLQRGFPLLLSLQRGNPTPRLQTHPNRPCHRPAHQQLRVHSTIRPNVIHLKSLSLMNRLWMYWLLPNPKLQSLPLLKRAFRTVNMLSSDCNQLKF